MSRARNRDPRPRRQGGGRSLYYAARREERGTVGQHAAEWSDAAAHSVFAALHEGHSREGTAICRYTEGILADVANGDDRFVARDCLGMCTADRGVALGIMSWHAHRLGEATTREARVRRVRTFLKPLRERARARGSVGRLIVTLSNVPPMDTFHKWLAARPKEERQRELLVGGRTWTGLKAWPRAWQEGWGVVCYERAAGRLLAEGGPSEGTVRALIRFDVLPTAVASAGDHYVLVGPAGAARYMSVDEVARAFGIASTSPLMTTLREPSVMTDAQAVSCLGRSVHVGVARLLVGDLLRRGAIHRGLTYGSAYSGVDGFAAALEGELGEDWHYRFASDVLPHVRGALVHAWSGHGLRAGRCHVDAAGSAAIGEERVDLWALTPSCEPFSRRNRARSRDAQNACLREVWASLGYARAAAPDVILVENVDEPAVTAPMTGLLQRLAGYTVKTGTLDPRTALGEPMARERRFWVLERSPGAQAHAAIGSESRPDDGAAQ